MHTLHPREEKVQKAQYRLMELLIELKKELTPGEYLQVITDELGRIWSLKAKYMVRSERHPDDPNKPGGLL